ncbi:transcriptional regulator, XRE family [Thermincola ferriacetica]|uniref:Transcriptional regulator, XRE family n=1 Tax=Thermincola ferriacetica TaxID=281456 RepID=A0A0L6W1X1_9FIRM|nr:helix-turn-helix transcriptional regulator [Thermincola ferriacetica]KNZ69577.1 transcriptional regulator, XRE family [Thermincola ferriacetica]
MRANVKTLLESMEKWGITPEELVRRARLPESVADDLVKGKEIPARQMSKLVRVFEALTIEDCEDFKTGKLNIGDRIRALREEKGLSLVDFGNLTGLSFTYLSELERGTTVPAVGTLKKIAACLGVPVSLFIENERKNSIIAEKLQYARKMRGLTQKELAVRAGISPGLVGQIEMGKVNASLKTIEKISQVLGVSVCYLILDREEVEAMIGGLSPELRNLLMDKKVQLLLGSICRMEEDKLKLVLNFADMLKNPRI